jgi:hypothetical protein
MIKTAHLHKQTYGAQDKHIEDYFQNNKYIFDGEFISMETFKFTSNKDLNKPTKIKINDYYSHMMDYGYSNIQLSDKYCSMIEKINIELGGQQINRIYPSKTGATRILEFTDTNTILPALCYHELSIVIYFKYDGTVELTVDKIKITNPLKNNSTEVMLKQTQCWNTQEIEITNNEINKINLNFNHPVKKITIIAEDDVEYNTILIFDLPKIESSENADYEYKAVSYEKKCVYEFEETINFSRINEVYLLVETSKPTKIHIFADTLHILRIMNGMAGLAFSK